MLCSLFSSLIAHILGFQVLFCLRNFCQDHHFLLIFPVPVLGDPSPFVRTGAVNSSVYFFLLASSHSRFFVISIGFQPAALESFGILRLRPGPEAKKWI